MWANIIAAVQLIQQLLSLLDRLGKAAKEQNTAAFLSDLEKAVDSLEKSKTPEEKRAVARDFVGIIRRL